MEYITVEEFLDLPKKVRELLLDWWEAKEDDLCTDEFGDVALVSKLLAEYEKVKQPKLFKTKYVKNDDLDSFKPILSEGQLRTFIEDTTNCYIEIMMIKSGYVFVLRSKKELNEIKRIPLSTHNLFTAYKETATEIAMNY